MNKEDLIAKLENGELLLNEVPERFKRERDIVRIAIKNGSLMCDVPNIFSNDKELLIEAADNCVPDLEMFINERLINDDVFITELLNTGFCFEERKVKFSISNFLLNLENYKGDFENCIFETEISILFQKNEHDRSFIKNVLQNNGLLINYFGNSIKSDIELVEVALIQNYISFRYFSDEIKIDKKFILRHISNYPEIIIYLSEDLKNDYEIVSTAIEKKGDLILYVSNQLKNDMSLALISVKHSGANLKYFSDEIQNNRQVVLAAVNRSYGGLIYASEKLKNDKEIALIALKKNKTMFQYLSDSLKNDKDILELVKNNIHEKKPNTTFNIIT